MRRELHLIDLLAGAERDGPPGHVAVQPMTLARDTRMALFQHPDSTVLFAPVALGSKPRLRFACGMKQAAWDRAGSAVLFEIGARTSGDREDLLFSLRLSPRREPRHRHWVEGELDLDPFSGKTVRLLFRTSVPPRGSRDYCWTGWADPSLEFEERDRAGTTPAARARRVGHVILVTADALRADHLGCYGNRDVHTPNLDSLADDGVLFTHARAQTGVTLGSYASLLSGRDPLAHGILAEWGTFPPHIPTLPVWLSGHGFRTLFAASEAELDDPGVGLSSLFAERIPCFGKPSQQGMITARGLLRRFDEDPEDSLFVWLQCFDTHPPQVPPDPFGSLYYRGDPTSPERVHRPDAVARIRGVESLQDILASMDGLARGEVDAALTARLRGTVDFLQGRSRSGPDLALHLAELGPAARRNRSQAGFAEWLRLQVASLEAGVVDGELVAWLKALLPFLYGIEADIVSWLHGVVDFRFPLAQYKASVSYLDHVVGKVISGLKERGIYEDATIVFTSPHGELFGEHGVYFHHHLLVEPVLRIPMIVKPGAASRREGDPRGVRVDGVFDSVDLLPTLLDLLGLPAPSALDGVSRWPSAARGGAIPPHESFAVDRHGLSFSVLSGTLKYHVTRETHSLSPGRLMRKGEEALFDVAADPGEEKSVLDRQDEAVPALKERLTERLNRYAGEPSGSAIRRK